MVKIIFVIVSILFFLQGNAQGNFPWERPLKMARSTDGTTFTEPTIFQDSSGVPSVIRWKGDTLACVFQWFRQPMNSVTWDRVAVKFSYNAGVTWTKPVPIIVAGIPSAYQRPFDPTLAVVSSSKLRIYFSSSSTLPTGGLDATVNTYSASSSNGINYTFESDPRFDHPTNRAIDPAVIFFNGNWHYVAPIGAPQDGAYHCTSSNGINFTQQSNFLSDANHNWTGNFMLNSPSELRFYGSGKQVWHNTSLDGNTWQGYVSTNIPGGDPSVVKITSTNYLAIFVGEPYAVVTKLEGTHISDQLTFFPNPVSDHITVKGDPTAWYDYYIYSINGKTELSGKSLGEQVIPIAELGGGLYLMRVESETSSQTFKFIKY